MSPLGEVRRVTGGYEVAFERRLPHPTERVWAMVTEPAEIRTWFCARVELDRRIGGRMVEHHDHVGMDVHGRVTRWEPPRVFEHTWGFGDDETLGSVRWELFPEGAGTRLRLTHLRDDLDAGGISGAHTSLDVLCDVLAGADPGSHSAPEGVFRGGEFVETRAGRGRWADREALVAAYERRFSTL